MIRCNCVVKNLQPITLLCFKQPMQPSFPVTGELEKKLLFVAPMGNVPHLPRNMMTVDSSHISYSLNRPFLPPKGPSKVICNPINAIQCRYIKGLAWSDPRLDDTRIQWYAQLSTYLLTCLFSKAETNYINSIGNNLTPFRIKTKCLMLLE